MRNAKIQRILSSSFFKDSSYMAVSTVGTQLIGIASMPFLSRLFSPEAFGVHGTFRSIILIVSIVLTLNVEMAIVIPKEEEDKRNIYLTTAVTIIGTTLLLALLYFGIELFQFSALKKMFKTTDAHIYMIIVGSVLVAITNLDQSWLVSFKLFKNIAISRFILPVFFFVFAIVFHFFSINIAGLIYAQVLAYVALFIYLQLYVKTGPKIINLKIFKGIYNKYRDIPLFTFPNTLLNVISLNIPFIILGVLYGDTTVGYYSVGVRLVSLPVSFIAASFSQIFYKKVVDIYNANPIELYPFVKKVMFILLFSGVVIFTIIYLLIPPLVPYFLGHQWLDSVDYLQYICFWQGLMLVNSPVSTLAILLNKQRGLLLFQILFLVFRCLALWLPCHLGLGPKSSVFYYSITGVLFNIYLFYFLLKIAYNSKRTIELA